MKRTRRLTALMATISVAILVTAGMAAAEPFRLILTHLEPPLVPNSVMDLALELGYFEREGVEVELVRVQQTPSALAAILAGEGEMANVSVDGVLQLVAQGASPLRAVTSPNKSLPFLIAARSDIATPADLAGHSFGVGRIGSLDHSLSAKVMAGEGVDMATLNVVTLGQPSVRAQALAAGQVDATTMSIGVWLSIPDKTGLSVLILAGRLLRGRAGRQQGQRGVRRRTRPPARRGRRGGARAGQDLARLRRRSRRMGGGDGALWRQPDGRGPADAGRELRGQLEHQWRHEPAGAGVYPGLALQDRGLQGRLPGRPSATGWTSRSPTTCWPEIGIDAGSDDPPGSPCRAAPDDRAPRRRQTCRRARSLPSLSDQRLQDVPPLTGGRDLVPAMRDVSLIADQTFITLVGPSGLRQDHDAADGQRADQARCRRGPGSGKAPSQGRRWASSSSRSG